MTYINDQIIPKLKLLVLRSNYHNMKITPIPVIKNKIVIDNAVQSTSEKQFWIILLCCSMNRVRTSP